MIGFLRIVFTIFILFFGPGLLLLPVIFKEENFVRLVDGLIYSAVISLIVVTLVFLLASFMEIKINATSSLFLIALVYLIELGLILIFKKCPKN